MERLPESTKPQHEVKTPQFKQKCVNKYSSEILKLDFYA